ncbi:hypothetical protein AGABI2DRAFT_118429 [Agaricus bisporus var. bisporus H97]|uniref:hypothetical protein n=1 Tax=Agaricus bisporus var. bisporus (strain H97 / ATCC MYA-4626 / FGSC 10389) TaxID=936046 RepID=UPI00029F5A7A|nr:hypothetical protein AGABI2DRAFT_118429 [Agaricus bisporus var. bisporus H97]EKV46226.1 hypothetical protein AGABI2DRAFT_118429 [Agaricus bisporus var. bisporus H97]
MSVSLFPAYRARSATISPAYVWRRDAYELALFHTTHTIILSSAYSRLGQAHRYIYGLYAYKTNVTTAISVLKVSTAISHARPLPALPPACIAFMRSLPPLFNRELKAPGQFHDHMIGQQDD